MLHLLRQLFTNSDSLKKERREGLHMDYPTDLATRLESKIKNADFDDADDTHDVAMLVGEAVGFLRTIKLVKVDSPTFAAPVVEQPVGQTTSPLFDDKNG